MDPNQFTEYHLTHKCLIIMATPDTQSYQLACKPYTHMICPPRSFLIWSRKLARTPQGITRMDAQSDVLAKLCAECLELQGNHTECAVVNGSTSYYRVNSRPQNVGGGHQSNKDYLVRHDYTPPLFLTTP